jgi:hypothetical protein
MGRNLRDRVGNTSSRNGRGRVSNLHSSRNRPLTPFCYPGGRQNGEAPVAASFDDAMAEARSAQSEMPFHGFPLRRSAIVTRSQPILEPQGTPSTGGVMIPLLRGFPSRLAGRPGRKSLPQAVSERGSKGRGRRIRTIPILRGRLRRISRRVFPQDRHGAARTGG